MKISSNKLFIELSGSVQYSQSLIAVRTEDSAQQTWLLIWFQINQTLFSFAKALLVCVCGGLKSTAQITFKHCPIDQQSQLKSICEDFSLKN